MIATTKDRRTRDLDAALKIDGWLTPEEGATLYDLARQAIGPIVEIGSHEGRSTAVLALGSMAGNGQPVYAIDPFIGVPPSSVETTLGNRPGWHSSSPERLRANLDRAGVNGLVKIIPLASEEAATTVPECALLFVDGDHSFEAAARDFDLYLPKVQPGGMVVIHDVTPGDPGVVEAFDSRIMPHLDEWRLTKRVDSAIVLKRAGTAARKVVLAFPGHTFTWGPISSVMEASLGRHEARVISGGAHGWDDFNYLWACGLNAFEEGACTHFAMLHSDIAACRGWLDILLGEMEDTGADMVSTVVPIKDRRGLTTTGIGDIGNTWGAFRRFTMREAMELPETFGIEHTPYPDKYLLVNSGCFVADLRQEKFRAVDSGGNLRAWFDFPTRISRQADGKWKNERESEDWFFSRKMHELGLRVRATRKVSLVHEGGIGHPNSCPWGTLRDGDEDTAKQWRKVDAD